MVQDFLESTVISYLFVSIAKAEPGNSPDFHGWEEWLNQGTSSGLQPTWTMYPPHTGYPATKSLVEDPCGALEHDPPAGVQVCVYSSAHLVWISC